MGVASREKEGQSLSNEVLLESCYPQASVVMVQFAHLLNPKILLPKITQGLNMSTLHTQVWLQWIAELI